MTGQNYERGGMCRRLSQKSRSVTIMGDDNEDAEFNLTKAAMNTLKDNQTVKISRVNATAVQVRISQCGVK